MTFVTISSLICKTYCSFLVNYKALTKKPPSVRVSNGNWCHIKNWAKKLEELKPTYYYQKLDPKKSFFFFFFGGKIASKLTIFCRVTKMSPVHLALILNSKPITNLVLFFKYINIKFQISKLVKPEKKGLSLPS